MRSKYGLWGLLATIVSSVLALSGLAGASSAFAASCKNTVAIAGQGSSLQKIAQETWIAGSGCSVTYTPSGSGEGRKVWGAEETHTGALAGTKTTPAESKDAFVASDEPLSEPQMLHIDEAAEGTEQTLVIPVAQAAVAVIVNPPNGCTVTQITNAELQKIWASELMNWNEIANSGSGCSGLITRVTRKDVSGTSFVFKTYLGEINMTGATCSTGPTWLTLAQTAHNLEWPECKENPVIKPASTGGGAEAELVSSMLGTIGYANLGDARKALALKEHNYHWLKVQNQHTSTFEFPGEETKLTETSGEANCKGTDYTNKPAETDALANDNWSEVNGAHPGNGTAVNTHYPICTLTYDIALMNYEHAMLTSAEGEQAKEYLEYVTSETLGQEALKGHDYRKVEEAVGVFALLEAKLVNKGGFGTQEP
jgi:ABC-type phosphate transport system substrate-binding protein